MHKAGRAPIPEDIHHLFLAGSDKDASELEPLLREWYWDAEVEAWAANWPAFSFPKGISFAGARFRGDVILDNATFQGHVNFTDARFDGHVVLTNARFIQGADFVRAIFEEGLHWSGAKISGLCSFEDAEFRDAVRGIGLEVDAHLFLPGRTFAQT